MANKSYQVGDSVSVSIPGLKKTVTLKVSAVGDGFITVKNGNTPVRVSQSKLKLAK